MLCRAASRAAFSSSRTAPAASHRFARGLASKTPPKKPTQYIAKDNTYKRGEPIKFAGGASQTKKDFSPNEFSQQEEAFNKDATPAANTEPEASTTAPKQPLASETTSSSAYSKAQAEFDSPVSPDANTTPGSTEAHHEPATETPQQPQQPLPDLRFGIPSTFDAEFGKTADGASGQAGRKTDALPEENDAMADQTPPSSSGAGGRQGGDLPKSAYETSLDRRRNKIANYMSLTFGLLTVAGAAYLGRDWDEQEARLYPDIPSGWGPAQVWDRIKARVSGQMGYYTEPTFPKLLPNVDPAMNIPPYTLVLSLEDLLIHNEWTRQHGWRTAKRPGVDYFLRYLSQYYEIVIFTSLPMANAELLIRKLDPFGAVMWPLFREATRYEKGEYIKDLSYLNRDLSKVIIMDTKQGHVKYQPENAIILPPWTGDPRDRDLVSYIPFLEYVASMGIEDARKAIDSFPDKSHIPQEFAAREKKAREAFQKQLAEERAKRPKRSGLSFISSALGIKPSTQVSGEIDLAKGYEEGKMLSDQIRERGQKQYEMMEKEIRENGEKWLKEREAEDKRLQEEAMKSMKSGVIGWFGVGPKPEGAQ